MNKINTLAFVNFLLVKLFPTLIRQNFPPSKICAIRYKNTTTNTYFVENILYCTCTYYHFLQVIMYRLSVVCSNNNRLLLLLLHISIHIIFISFYSDYLLICYCSAFRQRIVIWLLHNDKRKTFTSVSFITHYYTYSLTNLCTYVSL